MDAVITRVCNIHVPTTVQCDAVGSAKLSIATARAAPTVLLDPIAAKLENMIISNVRDVDETSGIYRNAPGEHRILISRVAHYFPTDRRIASRTKLLDTSITHVGNEHMTLEIDRNSPRTGELAGGTA